MSYMADHHSFASAIREASLRELPEPSGSDHPRRVLPTCPPRRISWPRQLVNRISGLRQRQSDLRVARYIRHRGGCLTDEVERELMRRLIV